MKNLKLLTALFLLTAPAFADTGIVVTPELPIDCAAQEAPHVNTIYTIQKQSETADKVVFTFQTAIGACADKVFASSALDKDWIMVSLLQDRITMPWESDPCEAKAELVSPNLALITISFDKTKLFRDSKTSENFRFQFQPQGAFNIAYPWNVELVNKAGETSMRIL